MGCPVIYDSHEVWPEAFLQAGKLEKRVVAFLERRAIQEADIVITVNPQIAHYLERRYGLHNVLAIPNAEPLREYVQPSCARPAALPVRFLLQGRIVPGRGFEDFFHAWALVEDDRAVLLLRVPMNEYVQQLCEAHSDLINKGRIQIAEAVTEDQLVAAASTADVGVIPYRGPNLNHVYGCPNKLSQYMQAGLAILSSSEMEYVSQMVGRYKCGLSYDPSKPDNLREIVGVFVNNTELLRALKENAHKAALTEFNWACLSQPYRHAIDKLFVGGASGR
jgi:glycosyltransferase involved in cell wall biosynthesis